MLYDYETIVADCIQLGKIELVAKLDALLPANWAKQYGESVTSSPELLTVTVALTTCGVCPLATWATIHPRPCGVRRAFLWTFIRLSFGLAEASPPSASPGKSRMDNPLKAHS